MRNYARLVEDVVVETIALDDDLDIAELFHPDLGFVPCTADVGQGWTRDGESWAAPVVTIEWLKMARVSAIDTKVAALLAAGAPVDGDLHVGLDDSSRADLGAMATTALAAAAGSVPWPESYQQGWITKENVRIPMAEAADGLLLAAVAGDYYARIRQRGRTLKDEVEAAVSEDELDEVNIDAGWPG